MRFLITGGRAPVALDLARHLSKAGHSVYIAESLGLTLSRYSNAIIKYITVPSPNQKTKEFITAIKEIILSEKIDVLIPTCEEAFFISMGKKTLEPHCKVWIDSIEKLKTLHSKWDFIQYCNEIGLQAPNTVIVSDQTSLQNALNTGEDKYVIKPVFSRFASNTWIGTKKELIEKSNTIELNHDHPWVVQQYIPGKEYCTYAVASQGKLLGIATYDHEFTAGKGAGICFESIRHQKIENFVNQLVEKMCLTGQIAFDFIETTHGDIYPLECNPRATSGLHLLMTTGKISELFLEKIHSEVLRPRLNEKGMIQLAMWTHGLFSIRSIERLKHWIKIQIQAREVVFSPQDLKPFFGQFLCFAEIVLQARKKKITPLEQSTEDIEWNGHSIPSIAS